MELYRRARPAELARVQGQGQVVAKVENMIRDDDVPHFIILAGPSGTGKTTVARIIKEHLKCVGSDFTEIDAATNRGIDDVREVKERMWLSALRGGRTRVWLWDEGHMLTREAQNAMLKMLEDGHPDHAYFMLSTTELEKLLPTVRSRACVLHFKPFAGSAMEKIIRDVVKEFKMKVHDEAVDRIVLCAEGNARRALVMLEQASKFKTEVEQMQAVEMAESNGTTIELCRLLLDERTKWPQVAAVLKTLDEEPERVRWAVLGYARNVLVGGGKRRAAVMIDAFARNYFDTKAAGLALSCYEVIHAK